MPLTNARHDILSQRRLTREHGEFVTLYRVMPCSCKMSQDGHPDPTCKVCKGSGRVYHEKERVKGLIAALNSSDKTLIVSGLAMPGDMTFSPEVKPMIPIHDYDAIRLDYGQPYEGDVLVRGDGDELFYLPSYIAAIEHHDPASGDRIAYTEGVDFAIYGKTISWFSAHGPAAGVSYAVKYHAFFDWVVYPGVTLQRIKRGTSLGQRVLLRKRHLAGVGMEIPDDTTPVAPAPSHVLLDSDASPVEEV